MNETRAATAPSVLVGQDLIRQMGIRAVIAEDIRTHNRNFGKPGLHALLVHRFGVWAGTFRRPIRLPLLVLYHVGFSFCRAMYGIELPRTVKLGRRFEIGHQNGIVVHTWATFGDDCTIRQGVTLGMSSDARWIPGKGPVIGNNVSLSPGCIIIGNVRIGDNVQLGPNCVVTSDVPSNRIVFTPPPRILPRAIEAEPAEPSTTASNEDEQ